MDKQIQVTKQWLKEVVVGLNLCPFAKAPLENNAIEVVSCKLDDLFNVFTLELEKLNDQSFETSLIVLENSLDFVSFYDEFTTLEQTLEDNALEEYFQLVAFHPEFVFQGLEFDDLANFVNRSPYPTIHILKKSSFDMLNLAENAGEEISFSNERLLKSLSSEKLKQLFPWLKL